MATRIQSYDSIGLYSDYNILCPCFNDPDCEDYRFAGQMSDYLWKYENCYQTKYTKGDKRTNATIVSLLKNDGTWDNVFIGSPPTSYIPINTADFEYHEKLEDYARSPDGYLKCRIVYNYPYTNSKGVRKNDCRVLYYVMDCKPQQVEMSYSGLSSEFDESEIVYHVDDQDEYLRDVRIGMKNLEGTTRVVVEQLDEFDYVPISYEGQDFKKGYFIATVDKEFSSSFTITAYNNSGNTRSETFTLPPLEPWDGNANLTITDNCIAINGGASRMRPKKEFNYVISSISAYDTKIMKSGDVSNNNIIDISDLASGLYVMTLYRDGKKQSIKFEKK